LVRRIAAFRATLKKTRPFQEGTSSVRKYLYFAAVAASAAVVVLPAASAYAATNVLTINKTGGTAVKIGAVLTSGLATGTSAVFSLGSEQLTCKAGKVSATVKTNPAKPGSATASLTAQSFSKCSINLMGIMFKSIKVKNLPYKASVSDASGFPVKVSGSSKTKPILVTVTATAGTTTVSCSFKAASIAGHASNTGNAIAFSKQKLTRVGTNALCPASANFSAKYGPVVDSSVTGSPKFFVN
jgi:hypothetical protein